MPNLLLLPPAHHKQWGWLIWTIILIGLLLGTIWFLRGCKATPTPIVQANAPQADYGTFALLDGGPSLQGVGSNILQQQNSYYHATLPDGQILFIADTNSLVDSQNIAGEVEPTPKPDGNKFSFVFDPSLNKFQDLPLVFEDQFGLDSYLLTKAGQLAVFDLTGIPYRDASGNTLNAGPGGVNPKLVLYNPFSGEQTEITPSGEDLANTHFAARPYLFEVPNGLLIGTVEYSQIGSGTAGHSEAVTFFYDYTTKQLTKQTGSIGLPDASSSTRQPTLQLSDKKSLIISGSNLYLFDHQAKRATFKRQIRGSSTTISAVDLIPNSSLVWLAVGNTDRALIYLYNFETNNIYSYRLGNLPLKQGIAPDISDALRGAIPRDEQPTEEEADDEQSSEIIKSSKNLYHFQPLADGTLLVSGNRYYDLPWSYGLTTLISNQWLERTKPAPSDEADPANNFSAVLASSWALSAPAYNCTIQASIPLPDGRVLYAGCRWFAYTPATAKTTFQINNPSTFGSQLGQIGHWTDGGKLLISDTQTPSNDPDYVLPNDAFSSFGTPFPLNDGRVFFFSPQYKASTTSDTIQGDVIGQLYNPASGKSRWVKSSILKDQQLFKPSNSGQIQSYLGVSDSKGNLHLIDADDSKELIFYPASGKAKLRDLKPADYGNQVSAGYITSLLTGPSVAIGNQILFFTGQTVTTLDIKTGKYTDLAKQREASWLKRHSKASVTVDIYPEIIKGLPIFDAQCTVINPSAKNNLCGVESALDLGNQRILLTSGKQIKIYNVKKSQTEDVGTLVDINNARRLFRMSDGRVAAVGPATVPTGEFWRDGTPMTTTTWVVEIIDIKQKTISASTTLPNLLVDGLGLDISAPIWILPNDRLLFATNVGRRIALYDLQRLRWLPVPEALINLAYNSSNLILQLPTQPMIVKVATKLSYTDYTQATPSPSSDMLSRDVNVLPANAVELFIPETGPWGYYDAMSSRFNWWLWFLTLQLVQAFAGVVVIVTKKIHRKFIVPL